MKTPDNSGPSTPQNSLTAKALKKQLEKLSKLFGKDAESKKEKAEPELPGLLADATKEYNDTNGGMEWDKMPIDSKDFIIYGLENRLYHDIENISTEEYLNERAKFQKNKENKFYQLGQFAKPVGEWVADLKDSKITKEHLIESQQKICHEIMSNEKMMSDFIEENKDVIEFFKNTEFKFLSIDGQGTIDFLMSKDPTSGKLFYTNETGGEKIKEIYEKKKEHFEQNRPSTPKLIRKITEELDRLDDLIEKRKEIAAKKIGLQDRAVENALDVELAHLEEKELHEILEYQTEKFENIPHAWKAGDNNEREIFQAQKGEVDKIQNILKAREVVVEFNKIATKFSKHVPYEWQSEDTTSLEGYEREHLTHEYKEVADKLFSSFYEVAKFEIKETKDFKGNINKIHEKIATAKALVETMRMLNIDSHAKHKLEQIELGENDSAEKKAAEQIEHRKERIREKNPNTGDDQFVGQKKSGMGRRQNQAWRLEFYIEKAGHSKEKIAKIKKEIINPKQIEADLKAQLKVDKLDKKKLDEAINKWNEEHAKKVEKAAAHYQQDLSELQTRIDFIETKYNAGQMNIGRNMTEQFELMKALYMIQFVLPYQKEVDAHNHEDEHVVYTKEDEINGKGKAFHGVHTRIAKQISDKTLKGHPVHNVRKLIKMPDKNAHHDDHGHDH